MLRGEEAADATRQRRAAARRKVDGDARRRADNFEVKMRREKHLAEAVEVTFGAVPSVGSRRNG